MRAGSPRAAECRTGPRPVDAGPARSGASAAASLPAVEIAPPQSDHRPSPSIATLRVSASRRSSCLRGHWLKPCTLQRAATAAKASFVASSAKSMSAAVCAVDRNMLWRGLQVHAALQRLEREALALGEIGIVVEQDRRHLRRSALPDADARGRRLRGDPVAKPLAHFAHDARAVDRARASSSVASAAAMETAPHQNEPVTNIRGARRGSDPCR